MRFMDFDREYTSIVYKSEAGNITLGEYVERGEELLKKVEADVIDKCISNIDELTTYYAGDKEGNALTPKVVIKEDVIKVLEKLKEQNKNATNRID